MRHALLLSLLALPTLASAVPTSIQHQGRLFDALSAPLTGSHDLHVKLYADPAGGTELWSETISTDFDNGYFAIALGDTTALSVDDFDGEALYVGIAVDSGPELSPRLSLDSVAYAMTATRVDGGLVDASEVQINGTTVITNTGTIDYDVLTDVPVDQDTLASLSCTDGDVAMLSGGNWACTPPADLDLGVVDIASLPVGTGTGQVAAGDHSHSDNVAFGRLPTGTGADEVAVGSHSHAAVTDFDVDGALDVTGDANITGGLDVGGDLNVTGGLTVDGGIVTDGPVCAGARCTWTFHRRSPGYDHPVCTNPGETFTLGAISGTTSGNSTAIVIDTTASHRGIHGGYFCYYKDVITAGDAIFHATPIATPNTAAGRANCGWPGDASGFTNVSHPGYSGGDLTYHIPLNCGATSDIDFTITYERDHFAPNLGL